ncbi:site-specific integrase [Vibrio vulnificus]|uniref:site-specific integrase n=1 Tax=Vibrio vulnificus TaxID=672 RepID=UPI0010292227|nr:site-specific integrase [Vibrio vulnificus]RZP53888.1 site-specific integrase [Vibrio vulnificus]
MKTIKTASGAKVSFEEFVEDIDTNHIDDVLLPAIERGNWDELESLAVINDSEFPVLFEQNVWELSQIGDGYQTNRLLFNHSTKKGFDGYILPRNIRNEIKCFAAVELLTDYGKYSYTSIVDTVSKLTVIAKHATEIGITSFSDIDEDAIFQLQENGLNINDKGNKVLSAINRLVQCQEPLPIQIEINKSLEPKHFNLPLAKPDQHFAIPFRIYFEMVNCAISEINEAYKNRLELEESIETYLEHSERVKDDLTAKVRSGAIDLSTVIADKSRVGAIERYFKSHRVLLVDNQEDDRWGDTWLGCVSGSYNGNKSAVWNEFAVKVGSRHFNQRSIFIEYIRNLQASAAFLVMALSGMRISELYGLSPVYGAQDHIKIGVNTIYALTTKQEKLTLDSQTADDVFITNRTGFRAFHVLNAIHRPYRKRFKEGSNSVFFAALTEVYHPRPIEKVGLGKTIRDTVKRVHKDIFVLNSHDLDALRASNPEHSRLPEVGDSFPYTNHQCRRSFAYYLIGLELMDFPQLKQQLGHISIAMTRWYARNAHSLKKIYGEIEEERVERSAKILSRTYNKLANKERLAGGLGKNLLKEVIENENYFEQGVNNRKLAARFWKEEIKTGKVHVHAVGKGMYCTKRQCAMRAAIDLSECTDCGWDIIEDASEAESIRMTAMRNLLTLQASGELNGSSASKFVMDIRSAEKIMSDLHFPFEAFDIPDYVVQLIPVQNI